MAAPAVSGLSWLVQCFCTSVVRLFSKLVRSYATTLYSAASKQEQSNWNKKLEQVEKEFYFHYEFLCEEFHEAKSLNDMTAKEMFSPLTSNLINLLAENVHHGEAPCTVTTSSPLDEATLTELQTVLKSFLSKGQVLKLEVKVDLSMMRGMIVRIGEKYADMSTKTKIRELSRAMWEVF
ncbi:unnamed protein product [Nyctereutes procyonoides]|uniref:(raccoon dog) hypothetical protein n=1 Tax=Nyctereutes procyonoides TaxID=34880 RepID=A0A811XVR4_NYCPR|nr:unnamed protein product [Nyctereutes procyonoides]